MNANYGLVEMVIFFAAVLGFAIWQLVVAERTKKRLQDKEKTTPMD